MCGVCNTHPHIYTLSLKSTFLNIYIGGIINKKGYPLSILIIKQELEDQLNTNITTVAIKWANTSVVTLNGTTLTQAQVDDLTVYIEPKIIPISSPRDLVSTVNGVNYQVFFQVDIWIKKNQGTGNAYVINDALDTLYRDKNFNGVVCEQVDSLTSFELDEWVIFPVRVLARVWG